MIGPKTTKVPMMLKKVIFKLASKIKLLITKAATANAIPTP
jgi:hypothetical protein